MSGDQILNDLKEKKLPTFGTAAERKDRLKKHYGTLVKYLTMFPCRHSCVYTHSTNRSRLDTEGRHK
jgi:hypothetical protein